MDYDFEGMDTDRSEWLESDDDTPAIDLLRPESTQHKFVLDYLVKRIEASERKMSMFYARWNANERRVQAYMTLPSWEQQLKAENDSGKMPKVTRIVIPYTYATISVIVTYLIQTFAGRKPMFQVSTYDRNKYDNARNMETVLQYQSDHNRMIRVLFQHFLDGETYGVAPLRDTWLVKRAKRTKYIKPAGDFTSSIIQSDYLPRRESATVYEGNQVDTIDPYMFFPDPRVPMVEVNVKGEYVFWREYQGKHYVKKEEAAGNWKWVDRASRVLPRNFSHDSVRSEMAGGDAHPGITYDHDSGGRMYQIDQGTCEVIPKELGLGDSEVPEKWLFTILNKSQIVQAEPFDADHDKHPVAVAEPRTMGRGFGHLGAADYLNPLQDAMSWFINSHIDNVRQVLNNMLVVDPSVVEMQDLKNQEPGLLIRMKRAAYGRDVRTAVHQLQLQDVTTNHVRDMQIFFQIGERISGITDNLMGLQDAGGRKTATEVRVSTEAGGSRLASHARMYSAQSIIDLTEQMCLNNQQYISDEFYLSITGQDGAEAPIKISPEAIAGDFYFPVHDGSLPIDKVALLDVWKEIMLGVAADQELRANFSIPKIFEYVAELGGAKNLDAMRTQAEVMPDQQLAGQQQAGNVVPIGASSMVNATPGRAANRAAGGLTA